MKEDRADNGLKKTWSTGAFAKLSGVSERTLRWYDKIGLLKPKLNPDNRFRLYQESDLQKLQRILLLKKLGFSLEEISALIVEDSRDLALVLEEQKQLIASKILQFQAIEESLDNAIELAKNQQNFSAWTLNVIEALNREDRLVEQYKDAKNLSIRIALHSRYSQNPKNWYVWQKEQMDLEQASSILEIGCGDGTFWNKNFPEDEEQAFFEKREVFLSDISNGMIADARKNLGSKSISFMAFDMMSIPFRSDFFDLLIASHVLFYAASVEGAIAEMARVLKADGVLYVSCYGADHMKEISELATEFDSAIYLSSTPLFSRFGLENGKELLEKHFQQVEVRLYDDYLLVDHPGDLANYILSCHGNQNEKLMSRYPEFIRFLEDKLENGPFRITKQAGLFICRSKA